MSQMPDVKRETEDDLSPLLQRKPVCPDCGGDRFLQGPEGGLCTNIKCDNCGSEFNWCPPCPVLRSGFAERIGGSNDENLIRRIAGGDFAKVFQVTGSQVLVTWNEDTGGGYYISMEFCVHGIRAEAKIGDFDCLEDCFMVWAAIDHKAAQAAYNNVKKEFLTIKNAK